MAFIKASSTLETKKTWNPTKPLPPELFRNVISFLTSTQDLLNLCLTSHLCCSEAERILYHTIDLAEDSETPKLWAHTILNNHRKAQAVRSLTMRFDLSFLIVPSMVLPSLVLISKALLQLQNLKTLNLYGHPTAMMHPICSWLLDGCTFELERFENEVLPPSSILPFISEQYQLRNWVQAGVFKRGSPEDFLPLHLTDLEIHASALQYLTTPRPLERLHLTMDHADLLGSDRPRDRERDSIRTLGLFSSTLTSLVIEHKIMGSHPANHLQPAEVLSLIAEYTPHLTFLSYQTTQAYTCPFTAAFTLPIPPTATSTTLPSTPPLPPQLPATPARAHIGTDDHIQNRNQYTPSIVQMTQLEVLILPLPPLPSAAGNQSRKHSRKGSVRVIADGILGASDSIRELSFVGDQREYTFVRTERGTGEVEG